MSDSSRSASSQSDPEPTIIVPTESTTEAASDPDKAEAVVLTEPRPAAGDKAPPQPAPPPNQPAAPPPARGGFVPAVVGGLLAAVAGYGAAHFNLLGLSPIGDTAAIEARLAGQDEATTQLRAELQRLAADTAAEPSLEGRVAVLEAALAALPPSLPPAEVDLGPLDARLTALEDRLATMEAMPAGEGAGSAALAGRLADIESRLAAVQAAPGTLPEDLARLAAETEARLAAAEEQARALEAQATDTARKAVQQAALGRIRAALDSGAPYPSALADLDGVAVPALIVDGAATGLPTLRGLADAFPETARAALEASLRADMGASWTERVSSFLRSQTGARSLSPREGDDPDAVLSRAEAAVANGDLPAALAEIAALPDAGRAAMAPWVAQAESRIAAEQAVAALAGALE